MKILILFTILTLQLISLNSAPFTATDMHKLNRLSGSVVSPDGKTIVYSLRTFDMDSKKAATHLEYYNIESKQTGKLTDPALNTQDFNPLFSKGFGNTLLFIRSSQIWSVDVPTTVQQAIPTSTQLTNYPVDVISFKWNWLTGTSLVFNSEVYSTCHADLKCTATTDAQINSRFPNSWTTYDKLMMRHWDKWLSQKVSHLLVQKLTGNTSIINGNVKATPVISGEPLELMLDMELNSPVGPFGGSEQYDVSPDGAEVAFTGAERTRDEAWNTGWKIYTAPIGTQSVTATWLTTHLKARTQNPKYSDDGLLLAYLAMDRVGLESDKLHVDVYNRSGKTFSNVTGSYDRSVNDFSWVDNKTIIFVATDYGNDKLFRASIVTQSDKKLVQFTKLQASDFYGNSAIRPIYGTNKYILERSSYQTTSDVWMLDYATMVMTQLTNVNPNLKDFELTSSESFYFPGGNGEDIQGFIFKPIKFNGDTKYPLAYLIHGGPEGAWESSWSYRWNVQLWTNRGYAVAVVNPHGSTGMGQKFTDLVRNDWGGLPYKDLMNGMDYIAKTYKWADTKNACACGASYGGYMVNWIQGQTDRFKCLVSHDGVFSTLTMFYATEEIWFPLAEYCPLDKIGCKPFDPQYRQRYFEYSPEGHVANWKTPMLVIHGSNDYRIPVSEGISVFTALQMKGIPSRFLHFTEENHWVLKPENSIKWYEQVLLWMDTYTGNKPPTEQEVNELKAEEKKFLSK